ncbi:hypothetical protein [Clostridium tetani]|uniref:Uncharacterized protein n=1 Tax=Clostridium tetani TaxID=1513 RepID=A0ABY0EVS8_CLOTA|nr:hypothetical protein [Clostridium tetani]RXI58949.1 hypothetical protein DP131_00315 [Clostridium tetani]
MLSKFCFIINNWDLSCVELDENDEYAIDIRGYDPWVKDNFGSHSTYYAEIECTTQQANEICRIYNEEDCSFNDALDKCNL